MAKEPAEPFRTKVRVKGARSSKQSVQAAPLPRTRSLMEALQEAESQPGRARSEGAAPAAKEASSEHQARESELPAPQKVVCPPKHRSNSQAARRLRRITRLQEEAAGLESLASGEIEEATVEIIRHDGQSTARQS